MQTSTEKLQSAIAYHQRGALQQAEQLYREVLQAEPTQPHAWNLLGALFAQLGRPDVARAHIQEALRLQPQLAGAHNNLGNVYFQEGKVAEAATCYREAVRWQPDLVDAHNNLGHACRNLGLFAEAVVCYRQVLRLQPRLAEAHKNLGYALLQLGQLEEAAACCREALRLQPSLADAHNNLGMALWQLNRPEEAENCFQQAVRLQPKLAAAHSNLGNALFQKGRLDEAVSHYQEALRWQPQLADAHNNLGLVRRAQGKWAEAMTCYRQALQLKHDYADAHLSRAMLSLLLGDFESGWPEYEWRWQTRRFPRIPFAQPRWDGAPLQGRTILLHAEQGLGDSIHFVRYAPLVKERGGRVIVASQPPLRSLLSTCPGIDAVVEEGGPLPPFDVHAPLLSLPALFRTTLATIPSRTPYLSADPALTEQWRQKLADMLGFKVGIVWQGNPGNDRDHWRSIALEQLAPLAEVPGTRLISLQRGTGAEQLPALQGRFEVHDLGEQLQGPAWTFQDTAALVMNLDLVVSVDTAMVHLAGALGKSAWVLLPHSPDWRWLLQREDSPWYPTLRLFRQPRVGNWSEVVQRVCVALEQRLALVRSGMTAGKSA